MRCSTTGGAGLGAQCVRVVDTAAARGDPVVHLLPLLVAHQPDHVAGLVALVAQARPGDVVGLMCHEERQQVYDWITTRGGCVDDPDTLRAKVRATGG